MVNRVALATRTPVGGDQLEAYGGQTKGLSTLHIPVGGLMLSPVGRVVNRIALAARAPVGADQLEAHGGQAAGLSTLHIPVRRAV